MNKELTPEEKLELEKRRIQQNAASSNKTNQGPNTTHLDHLNTSGQAPLFG